MIHRLTRPAIRRLAQRLAAFFFTLLCAFNSHARPDMTPLGPNIADKGSAFYHFTENTFDSADGKRHYKVWTGIPDKNPPASGYPVLYMLDGNAVMDRLSDPLFKQMSAENPPVLVVIGYQTTLPFDVNARAYDYTPPVKGSDGQFARQDIHGRAYGGGLQFRKLLEETIAPKVEKGLKIDPAKRGIWGHSYAGVFVLDSYLSSSFFNFYYTASPSLNRDYAVLADRLTEIKKSDFCAKQLFIMEGDDTPGKNLRAETSPEVLRKLRNTLADLHNAGLPVAYWADSALSHGQMFNASFPRALLNIASARSSNTPAVCPR